jgi:hypothetical protein
VILECRLTLWCDNWKGLATLKESKILIKLFVKRKKIFVTRFSFQTTTLVFSLSNCYRFFPWQVLLHRHHRHMFYHSLFAHFLSIIFSLSSKSRLSTRSETNVCQCDSNFLRLEQKLSMILFKLYTGSAMENVDCLTRFLISCFQFHYYFIIANHFQTLFTSKQSDSIEKSRPTFHVRFNHRSKQKTFIKNGSFW